jgi:hypothetical protein
MNPKNVPRSERHHMIKHRCPLLPKPDFVLCHRFKGKERFKGHYGLKPSNYRKIQTKDMAEINQTYKEKIREAEQKGPVYFVTHDTGNDTEAAKSNNLPSPVHLQIYDVWRGYRYSEVVLLRHTSIPHEKGVLVAIFCEIMGIDVETCKRIFGPHNARSNKLPSLAKYMKNGEVTPVPHFIWGPGVA